MKKVYPPITITVPQNIDYERVFKKIPLFINQPTKAQSIKVKESIYLFLSYLYPSNTYVRKYEGNGNWKPILMEHYNSITRNLGKTVIQILTHAEYPIIEKTPFHIVGVQPQSYRLKFDFYWKGCPPQKIHIRSVISQNYLKKVIPTPVSTHQNSEDNFDYLFKSYDKNILSLKPEVHDYIMKLEEQLITKNNKIKSSIKKEFYKKSIAKKINKLKNHVKNIEEGNYNFMLKKNNMRLYSELTYCNKELRKYLKINNKEVCEIDIIASHLYILSSILNFKFFNDIDQDFSLSKIYNKIYNKINLISESSNKIKFINNKLFITDNKDVVINLRSDLIYMNGVLNNFDVTTYKSMPFKIGVYDYLNTELFHNELDKKYIKRNVMFYLNQIKFRSGNRLVKKMETIFPTIEKIIRIFNGREKTSENLAILLHRVESYLLLEVGVQSMLKKLPNINFITVHDSIIVEKRYAEEIKEILVKSIERVTKIPIGFKCNYSEDPIDNLTEIVNDNWIGIEKSFRKARWKRRGRLKIRKDN